MITDPRADYKDDVLFDLSDLKTRDEFYLYGPFVGGLVGIDPAKDCINIPLLTGESDVGSGHIKLDCELYDKANGTHDILQTRLYRKVGELARDPVTGLLTTDQFESSTFFEQYQNGYGPGSLLAADKAAADKAAQGGLAAW